MSHKDLQIVIVSMYIKKCVLINFNLFKLKRTEKYYFPTNLVILY